MYLRDVPLAWAPRAKRRSGEVSVLRLPKFYRLSSSCFLFLHTVQNAIRESTTKKKKEKKLRNLRNQQLRSSGRKKSEDILYELRDITVTCNPKIKKKKIVALYRDERAICDGYTI